MIKHSFLGGQYTPECTGQHTPDLHGHFKPESHGHYDRIFQMDKIQSFEIKQNGLNILFDTSDKKVCIKNNSASLIDLFQDLKDLISQITVSTGTGPSGTPLPPTIASLNSFQTKFKSLLK
ncbi:MAG: hypothetical protein HYR91_11055 [Flavobacteriia bacterium]|nr:hypothetical protein [Flavobacteriia bacterium]